MSLLLNKMRLLISLSLFVILYTSSSFATSFYSSKYLGLQSHFTSGQGMGMGGLGIALIDDRSLNLLNPATLIPGGITRLSANFIAETISMQNSLGNGRSNYLNANGLQFLIPFGQIATLSGGIAPMFLADYEYMQAEGNGASAYQSSIQGKGSLNRAFLSLFWNVSNLVYLSGRLNYNFGKYDEKWRVDFYNDLYHDTSDILSTHYNGINFTYGIFFNGMKNLKLGLVLTTPVKLKAKSSRTYNFRVKTESEFYEWGSTDFESKHVKLPYAWGGGVSYYLKNKWIFGIDYHAQPWSKYEVDGRKGANDLKESYRISIGCQYQHSRDPFEKYYKHIPLRLGFYYRNLYFSYGNSLNNTHNIIEYAGTIGVGLPFYFYLGRLDLALIVGKRGSLEKNPVEENIVNLMITITGGEKWFVRSRKN